jgi:hypothetical protein
MSKAPRTVRSMNPGEPVATRFSRPAKDPGFSVVASPVAAAETATISVSTGGATGAATLVLEPMG